MKYSKEKRDNMFDYIISEITKGRALNVILKEDKQPAYSTVVKWIDDNEEYRKRYACACDIRAEILFDEILDIADNSENDTIITENGVSCNTEFVQRSRVRIDARKWIIAKMNPKKFGDKKELHVTTEEKKLPDWMKDGESV